MTTIAHEKSGLVELVLAAFARYRKRLARANELRALGDSETERMAHDLGLSRSDFMLLAAKDDDAADLLNRRLADSKIDIGSIAPVTLRDMQRCCAQCASKQQCAHELEDRPRSAQWPDYCPNEQTIATLVPATRQ